MTAAFEQDQEAIADIVYRSHSEHDRSRARPEAIADMRFGGGSPVVEQWRCRYPGPKSNAAPCRVLVDATQEIVEQLASFNAMLAKRGEEPIGTHEVLVCDAHKRLLADYAKNEMPRIRERKQVEMRDAIQKLKASDHPREERELLAIVEKLHHPDVEGLLVTLEEKLGGAKKRRAL